GNRPAGLLPRRRCTDLRRRRRRALHRRLRSVERASGGVRTRFSFGSAGPPSQSVPAVGIRGLRGEAPRFLGPRRWKRTPAVREGPVQGGCRSDSAVHRLFQRRQRAVRRGGWSAAALLWAGMRHHRQSRPRRPRQCHAHYRGGKRRQRQRRRIRSDRRKGRQGHQMEHRWSFRESAGAGTDPQHDATAAYVRCRRQLCTGGAGALPLGRRQSTSCWYSGQRNLRVLPRCF
ncbi:unnamed protein product, partial [Phaeothamnion confervicola]